MASDLTNLYPEMGQVIDREMAEMVVSTLAPMYKKATTRLGSLRDGKTLVRQLAISTLPFTAEIVDRLLNVAEECILHGIILKPLHKFELSWGITEPTEKGPTRSEHVHFEVRFPEEDCFQVL